MTALGWTHLESLEATSYRVPAGGGSKYSTPSQGFFSYRSPLCNGAEIIENPGCDSLFKISGRKNCFEVEKYERKNSKIQFQFNRAKSNHADSVYADSVPSDSTNIEPKNQHYLAESSSFKKTMSWVSHDLRTSTISDTSQASTFYTRTPLAHNNVSSIHTHYLLTVPHYKNKFHYGKNYSPSPFYGQSSQAIITPTEKSTPCNNPPKQVPYVPIDPNSYPSLLDSSLLDSYDSSDSGYSKLGQRTHTHKKFCIKNFNDDSIKKCANLTAKLLKYAYNSRVTKFKLDEDPLQSWVYFLSFVNSLETYYHDLRILACWLCTIHP